MHVCPVCRSARIVQVINNHPPGVLHPVRGQVGPGRPQPASGRADDTGARGRGS